TQSYAITNHWQLLSLLKRRDIAVRVRDMPFLGSELQAISSVFDPVAVDQLRSIPLAGPDDSADVTLRWYVPYDFSPSKSRSTAVFGTCEFQCVPPSVLSTSFDVASLARTDLTVVTPSNWSAEGFRRLGFEPQQIVIVPHGVDGATFRPQREE